MTALRMPPGESPIWDRLRPETWDPLFQQQNSKKLYGTKNACMCSWGKFWTQKKQETKKPNCHFWGAWSKNKSVGSKSKAGYCAWALHTTPLKLWAKPLRHPSGLTLDTPLPSPRIRKKLGTLSENLLLVLTPPGPNKAFAWISCLATDHFLLIKEDKAILPGR